MPTIKERTTQLALIEALRSSGNAGDFDFTALPDPSTHTEQAADCFASGKPDVAAKHLDAEIERLKGQLAHDKAYHAKKGTAKPAAPAAAPEAPPAAEEDSEPAPDAADKKGK